MRNKFRDATSSIGELRRRKKELSDVLHNRFKYPRSKCRNLIKTYMEQAAYHKERHKDRLTKKFKHCRKRMKVVTNDLLDKKTVLPQDVQDLIGGVNIFTTTIEPERSADPMVFDKTIKLSKSELAFLRKGPKFMMRQTVSEGNFCTEIGKMIVKEKNEEMNWSDMNTSTDSKQSSTPPDTMSAAEKQIIAEAGMTYDKETRVIDMGRFKATNYKFNRYVHLPEAGSVEREARYEIRKRK